MAVHNDTNNGDVAEGFALYALGSDGVSYPVQLDEATGELSVQLSASAVVIGSVAIDQTTPGTTNGVEVNAALPTGGNTIGKVEHTSTGLGHGVKTVTSAGTDEALVGSSTPAKWIIVQAQTDNTNPVAVGASGVDATEATGTGIRLAAGESVTLPIDNVADVFVDADTSGEGVRFIYGT